MSLENPVFLLLTITLCAIIASTNSDPVPVSKKTEAIEKAKSNTRHDHSSGSNSNGK